MVCYLFHEMHELSLDLTCKISHTRGTAAMWKSYEMILGTWCAQDMVLIVGMLLMCQFIF